MIRPISSVASRNLLLLAVLIGGLLNIGGCITENQTGTVSQEPTAQVGTIETAQSATMYAGTSTLLSIYSLQTGNKTYTYSYMPDWLTEKSDSSTTGVLDANPPLGTEGHFKFAIQVYVDGVYKELIIYTLTVIVGG